MVSHCSLLTSTFLIDIITLVPVGKTFYRNTEVGSLIFQRILFFLHRTLLKMYLFNTTKLNGFKPGKLKMKNYTFYVYIR